MTKAVFILSMILSVGALGACENTADGFGKDMEHAGQSIQKQF